MPNYNFQWKTSIKFTLIFAVIYFLIGALLIGIISTLFDAPFDFMLLFEPILVIVSGIPSLIVTVGVILGFKYDKFWILFTSLLIGAIALFFLVFALISLISQIA